MNKISQAYNSIRLELSAMHLTTYNYYKSSKENWKVTLASQKFSFIVKEAKENEKLVQPSEVAKRLILHVHTQTTTMEIIPFSSSPPFKSVTKLTGSTTTNTINFQRHSLPAQ